MNRTPARANIGRIVLGTAIMAWGLILTIDHSGIVRLKHAGSLWPLLFIALGVGRFLGSDCHRGRRSGVWLILLGLWFSLNELTVFGYHDTWPLLVVAAGAMLVWDVIVGSGVSAVGGGGRS